MPEGHVDNNDAELQKALAGDQLALARVLVAHSPRLTKRISLRLESSPFIDFGVDDVVQEVFIDVLRGIGTFRQDDGAPFAVWLDHVADYRLSEMLRRRGRKKRGGDFKRKQAHGQTASSIRDLVTALSDRREATGSAVVNRADIAEAIHRELADLPSAQRQAVNEYFLDERSLDSTASELNTTPGAVRGLLHRAKRAMRQALGHSSRWFHKK